MSGLVVIQFSMRNVTEVGSSSFLCASVGDCNTMSECLCRTCLVHNCSVEGKLEFKGILRINFEHFLKNPI